MKFLNSEGVIFGNVCGQFNLLTGQKGFKCMYPVTQQFHFRYQLPQNSYFFFQGSGLHSPESRNDWAYYAGGVTRAFIAATPVTTSCSTLQAAWVGKEEAGTRAHCRADKGQDPSLSESAHAYEKSNVK